MKKCRQCGEEIPAARLAALPSTKTCIKCSKVKPQKGFMTWEHKTAPTFNLVTEKEHEYFQKRTRKGVHASLPMGRKDAGRGSSRAPAQYDVVKSNVPAARCHPDRPRVNSSGKCFECALEWYEKRRK